MLAQDPILLFVSDASVLSSLQFSLAIEGFHIADGAAEGIQPSAAAALVIDACYRGDGLAALAGFRLDGCAAPAILLATNPGARLRSQAAAAGVELIEKPLLGDELGCAIRTALEIRKAA